MRTLTFFLIGSIVFTFCSTGMAAALPDSVYSEAEICHVVVFGYARDEWIDSPEYTWFYSGAVVDVDADTMLVATCIHSSGLYDMNRGFRLGSSPEEYALYVSFATGLLLPVQEMSLDVDSRLLYLKLYIGDLLVNGYDYTCIGDASDLATGANLFVAYFRPGQGRLRNELQIINRSSGAENSDIWNFEHESILSEYRFDKSNNGSPVFYHDNTSDSYHLQGLLYLREFEDRVDNVVFPIPTDSYIDSLTWKKVNSSRVEEIRNIRLLPL